MKGGTSHIIRKLWQRVLTKGGGDDGKWWRWEVVRKGSGDDGKWWWRGVVRKGGGDDGKWWGREVVRKGSGDDGKWWWRGVVRKGGADDGKWWGREVVTKGSGDDGKWWWRGVVRKGGGDDGKWWGRAVVRKGSGRREVVTMGSGDDGKWWGREVVTKRGGDDGKWWQWEEVVRKWSGDEGKWWVGEEAGARNLVFFSVKWLQPAMQGTSVFCNKWLCLCVQFYAWFEAVVADRVGMAAWMLHGDSFGEEAGARNLVFFRVKWLQPAMKGTSSVRRLRLRPVCLFFCRSVMVAWSCFGSACVCVVIGCFRISGCRSHWNGCMTVVI